MQERLETFLKALAENRIKRNVDFALIQKYSQNRILCHDVWLKTIQELAKVHNVEIVEYFTFW